MKSAISILLVNPWIYDFAAYNLWSEPIGLAYIGGILKQAGIKINVIDCLFSRKAPPPRLKENGCSKFRRQIIEKPPLLDFVPRNYASYGISEEEFLESLQSFEQPDIVLITSVMTYWYPGVFKTIKLIKHYYGDRVPIVLGGLYATLCRTHALKHSGANFVFSGNRMDKLIELIEKITDKKINTGHHIVGFKDFPIPPHDLFRGGNLLNLYKYNFFVLLTRRGCPFRCSYCASPIINPEKESRKLESIIEEVETYTEKLKATNIAFYDDALLWKAEDHLIPIMEKLSLLKKPLKFHLPNAVHSRFITRDIANLLKNSGFETVRLGLESSNESIQKNTGNKISNQEYIKSVEHLLEAGFTRKEIGTYILVGLPGQSPRDVESTISFVHRAGASPYLSFYSPIPLTPMFEHAKRTVPIDIQNEPLYHNNTVFVLKHPAFSSESIQYLKDMAKELRG